jgi:hypothetical protein
MSDFSISARWLDNDLDSPEETASLAEVSVVVGNTEVSSMFDPQTGETVEGPRLPAIVLATGLADHWWTFLYEPQKVEVDPAFEARHRLDALTRGYVFPPLALWPAGEAMMASILRADTRFHRQVFAMPEKRGQWVLPREGVEEALGGFIKSTIDRLTSRDVVASTIEDTWKRIEASASDPDERIWCINAGRLGLDPYDPDTPDLNRLAEGLPEALFGDICEAAAPDDIFRTCQWAASASNRIRSMPAVPMKAFAAPPRRDLSRPGCGDGYDAARLLRSRIGLPADPKEAVSALLGDAENPQGQIESAPREAIEGITRRRGGEMRAVLTARSPRQRRFRMCRAVYLAWRAGSNGDAAATTAITWRQQASRAFAAELLAPADLLKERAGKRGLTRQMVERLASEWTCPPQAIIHQAQNHNIRLLGVESALHNY